MSWQQTVTQYAPMALQTGGTIAGTALGGPLGGAIGGAAGTVAGLALDAAIGETPEEKALKKQQKNAEKAQKEYLKYLQSIAPDNQALNTYLGELSKQKQALANDPLGKELRDRYSGKTPSAAEMLLKKGQEAAYQQQLSSIASARGGVNYAALARTASNNIAMQNQKAMQDAAILRAQEQERLLGQMIDYQSRQRQEANQMASQAFNANQIYAGQQLQYGQALGAANAASSSAARDAMSFYTQQSQAQQQQTNAVLSSLATLGANYAKSSGGSEPSYGNNAPPPDSSQFTPQPGDNPNAPTLRTRLQ